MEEPRKEPKLAEPSDSPLAESPLIITRKSRLSKRSFFIIGFAFITVIVAAIAIWLAYASLHKPTNSDDLSKATRFNSVTDLIASATETTKGEQLDTVKNDGLGGTTEDGFLVYSYPSLLVEGYEYRVQPLKGEGRGYSGDSVAADSDFTGFTKFLTDNHYVKTSTIDGNNGYISAKDSVTYSKYSTYESNDIICSVWHADASQTDLKNHIASIGCADKASYKESAAQLKPFYTAYKSANANVSSSELIFGSITLADARDGYKNASVYQDDPTVATKPNNNERTFFQGLYYTAPGSSAWTYVERAKDALPLCSTFSTDVLKNAFSGTQCAASNGSASSI